MARYQPTLFFSVPALYAAMVKAPGAGDVDFGSVRTCVSAAEALPAAVLARWQAITGVPILDGIGSTEMLHIYCSNTLEDLAPGTSGRPVPGYELRIVDERGLDVAPGEPGDLMVRGDSCAGYYWHQREKTRYAMRGDWFHTGDRYVVDGDGHYVYQGRSDDMIKVGGLWVSPADVEGCLVRHPAVSEAAVIGVHVDDLSRIKAFVICASPPEDRGRAGRGAARMVQGEPSPIRVPARRRVRRGPPAHADRQGPALQAPRGRGGPDDLGGVTGYHIMYSHAHGPRSSPHPRHVLAPASPDLPGRADHPRHP